MESEQLGIKLNTYVEPNTFINADRGGLMQIVTNLFNNSKEALQGNAGVIEINCRKDNGSIIIALDDSGPGVADDNLKEIFKPFFTTKENGTGLGLPTVHRIVREFGGEIKYERSKLGGARFVMVFKT
jgi:C4-dicarboxylate-specific signal transduction histidine kinase